MPSLAARAVATSLAALMLAAPVSALPDRAAPTTRAQVERRPNIIFILADDLGYGQLGIDGQKRISTPNIDRMAREGMRFSQAYAGAPVCSPSRVALLTGRDGRRMRDNTNDIELDRRDGTLPQLLAASGYETALIGKYGVGSHFGNNDPMAMGFTHWYGFLDNISAHRQYPKALFRDNALFVDYDNIGAKKHYAQRLFTDQAVKFIAQDHDKPFFLDVSFTTPHAELAAPPEFVKRYSGKFEEKPYLGMTGDGPKSVYAPFYPEPVAEPNATMAAMVTALDQYVGEILSAVEKAGIADNTIVIFTSDNGPHEEGGANPYYFDASGPFRGIKRDLYDGGIHVPMLVRWPGKVAAGRVDPTPIAFWDMLPTFCDLADIRTDAVKGVDSNGVSLAALLTDPKATVAPRTLYWAFKRTLTAGAAPGIAQAARQGDWKAVRYGESKPVELYDIIKDPGEAHDLATQYPDRARAFTAMFDGELR